MFVGWIVGRVLKFTDVETIIMLTVAGGGSLLTGLAYLWIADITVGQSGSLMWFVVGGIGGAIGVVVYLFTRYLDDIVRMAKQNGLL